MNKAFKKIFKMRKKAVNNKNHSSGQTVSFLRKNSLEICSLFVAFLALLLTVWQGCDTKQHNKLSVVPKLMFSYLNYNKDGGFEIALKNSGVGPAIIDDIVIEIDNNKYKVSELHGKFWYKILADYKIPDSIIQKQISHYFFEKGSYIPASQSESLLLFSEETMPKNVYIQLKDMISKLSIIGYYHSVYNETYSDSLYFYKSKYYLAE